MAKDKTEFLIGGTVRRSGINGGIGGGWVADARISLDGKDIGTVGLSGTGVTRADAWRELSDQIGEAIRYELINEGFCRACGGSKRMVPIFAPGTPDGKVPCSRCCETGLTRAGREADQPQPARVDDPSIGRRRGFGAAEKKGGAK